MVSSATLWNAIDGYQRCSFLLQAPSIPRSPTISATTISQEDKMAGLVFNTSILSFFSIFVDSCIVKIFGVSDFSMHTLEMKALLVEFLMNQDYRLFHYK